MDWSKTKSIFIIVFLILDIYLAQQYINIRNTNQLEVVKASTFEEKLKKENITYVKMSNESVSFKKLSGTPKIFNSDDFRNIKETKVTIMSNSAQVDLLNPFKINDKEMDASIKQFTKEYVYKGADYSLFKYEKKENVIYCYQTFEGKMLFHNANTILILYLNENNEIKSFEQSILVDTKEFGNSQKIIPATKAMEFLYNKGYLPAKCKVTKAELGYFTLLQTTYQVLEPTWHFVVVTDDREADYYVTAYEGVIHTQDRSN